MIFKHHEKTPLLCFDTIVSAAALRSQLEAKQRVKQWCAAERETAAQPSFSTALSHTPAFSIPNSKGKKKAARSSSTPCGLTKAQIRALQSRELTPEDYDLLMRLDESVEKRNVLSQSEASALVETTLEGDAECSVCLCDLTSGECCIMLHCGHHFHPDCIKGWLVRGKNVCPMCNAQATQDAPSRSSRFLTTQRE